MQEDPDTRNVISQKRGLIIFVLISFFTFLIDQLTKHLFFSDIYAGRAIVGNVLQFVLHTNYGMSFNIPIPRLIILGITFLVLISILYVMYKKKVHHTATWLGLALVFGGAIGNMSDRILFSYVRDWLLLFGRSAINLADISILIGIALYLFSQEHHHQESKEAA